MSRTLKKIETTPKSDLEDIHLGIEDIEIIGDSAIDDWSPPPTFALAHPENWGQWLADGGSSKRKRSTGVELKSTHLPQPQQRQGFYNISDFISSHSLEDEPALL